MSGLAILLIIGSAVVGPIEAQPTVDIRRLPGGYVSTPPEPTDFLHALVSNCKAVRGLDTYECRKLVASGEFNVPRETLPQLCERAMRDIGAWTNAMVDPDKTGSGYMLGRMPDAMANDVVRCIPTPTGYRK